MRGDGCFGVQLLLSAAMMIAAISPAVADEFDAAGVKIHHEVAGEGEPVILIRGLYASGKLNWTLPGVVADLSPHFRVITLDNRGHGQSGKPTAEVKAVRADGSVHLIANARHLLCVATPDFKAQLHAALNEHAGGR